MSNDIEHIKDGLASIGAVHPHYAGVISNAIQCMDKQAEIVRAFGVLEGDVEEGIEAAYWEMQARMDPTQTQYPNAGERYAFKMAVRNLFYKLRDPQQPE